MASPEISDIDPSETQEWLEALASIIKEEGKERAGFIVAQLQQYASSQQVGMMVGAGNYPFATPYVNTIAPQDQAAFPQEEAATMARVNALIRWNAIAMVLRATKKFPELGGHLATYASAATLYDIGYNYFFHAPSANHGGDLVYVQGHASPGIYARAFLEGRLTETQLDNFRQEVEKPGLSSYPHPWLMPDFWQVATVSMGLGPLQGIYQARFLKYLHNRNLLNTENRKIWVFCGDGEMDEPESMGALTLAGREQLDNLIFVINCNLQRLDGPVRGNGKIIQELESAFRGAGWNVIKVIWGSGWDKLLARDTQGLLQKRMLECIDGEYQKYRATNGAYIREHFFGKYPELKEMVADLSDDDIWHLTRGGHDPAKVYAAYAKAVAHRDQPTVILAKTVKGYGLGPVGEASNTTHQLKKMTPEQLRQVRDRFQVPLSEEEVEKMAFYHPGADSPEVSYLKSRRAALGGPLPARRKQSQSLDMPKLEMFAPLLESTQDREISTTMAFVRALNILMKDKDLGPRVVPIIPDESRTFGMEGMFRQFGIYSPQGQLYEPEDVAQLMYYREDKQGQMLEEGITEAGAFCSWIAAGNSYSVNDYPMIPFYIYYSMFGFQRVGDLAWAAADMQVRGFLLGATAGRTTLAGEGLQHQDGHSHLFASTIPNCIAYDLAYAYEVAVIIQNGLHRMYQNQENVFFYITLFNENYPQPAMPKGAEEGILKGMHLVREGKAKAKMQVQLLGSGTILREVLAAAETLENEYGVATRVWSVTSFNELRKEALEVERHNRLHPADTARVSYVTTCLQAQNGPVIAASDNMRIVADQIRAFVPHQYVVLGTDGFGRSDTRAQLRHFFEVDSKSIVLAALKALADESQLPVKQVQTAITALGINSEKPNPTTV